VSSSPSVSPTPPAAPFALPWDDPDAPEPAAALARARAELGDTFTVASGGDTYLFVFSAPAVRAFYEVPERTASKGLADYTMLVRKLPDELFAGPRTMAHDLFGAQDVEGYLGHLDHALDMEVAALGDAGTVDVFELSRRVGHRLGLSCWLGDAAAGDPWFDGLRADLDVLDGAEAFVHPERMVGIGAEDRRAEREALARVEATVGRLLEAGDGGEFLDQIVGRWDDTAEPERTRGAAREVVLLHIATMTNLFAAMGWTIGLLALHPDVADRARRDDDLLDRCISEAIRLGQVSIMMRTVLRDCTVDDGDRTWALGRGTVLATTLAVTNTGALADGAEFRPGRWDGRRLRDGQGLVTPELVATFGFGPHRCPAQRFSRSAIARTVRRLSDTYELVPRFDRVRSVPGQIGGVGRAADPCPLAYVRRPTSG
jgi:cytochrome P450